ncbi:hypothetical protein BCU91_11950 [Shewanella sp. 10N.286.52.B9]|nr:hypothetical protein BCU91_11950 [Shewanella sp. 10N.286.52.B9]
MQLDKHLTLIRNNKEKVLPILSGVLLYRQLQRNEKNRVLPMAKSLGDPVFLYSIQTLIAQNIANPNWNKWCLSDTELRAFFDNNRTLSSFISSWFFTIEPKLEVSWLVPALFGVSMTGFKGWVTEASGVSIVNGLSNKTGMSITKSGVSTVTKSFVLVTILASVMKGLTDSDLKGLQEELLNRGLLTTEDL